MAKTSEDQLIDFIKAADSKAEMTVREDPPGLPEENTEAIRFSDVAQDGNKDTKEGVPERVLTSKPKTDAADRALIGAVLTTRDFETSSIHLKPVEKVSHPRQQTLLSRVVSLTGRA
jgi:hypothetical protein